jgi:hypothetical protein
MVFDMRTKNGKGYKRTSGELVKNNKRTVWVRVIKKVDGSDRPNVIKRHKKKHNVSVKKGVKNETT